jgi:hypothetical protein
VIAEHPVGGSGSDRDGLHTPGGFAKLDGVASAAWEKLTPVEFEIIYATAAAA